MKLANYLRRVAVLGAGHVGIQLAAHLANAGVEVYIYDLPAAGDDPLGGLRQRLQQLRDSAPAVLVTPGRGGLIHPMTFGADLRDLQRSDLVIEAVAEDLDIKTGLLVRVAPFISQQAMLVTTTSGLSVETLARVLPEALRWRFCGLHMLFPGLKTDFAELVPSPFTDNRVLDHLETFLVQDLGKQVIRVADQPYFIAARLLLLATWLGVYHGERLGLGIDQVDTLSGMALGRPHRGCYGLLEQLGVANAIDWWTSAQEHLADDPWLAAVAPPDWLRTLAAQGQSLYLETASGQVWDHRQRAYRPEDRCLPHRLQTALALEDLMQRWTAIRLDESPQAQFLWALQRDLYHYSSHWLGSIAPSARELDLALRWGLGWSEGLLETWQRCGWRRIRDWLAADIRQGHSVVAMSLASWTSRGRGVHGPQGSSRPGEHTPQARPTLAVYRRQWCPDSLYGEVTPIPGKTLWSDTDFCLWDGGDGVGIIDFTAAPANLNGAQVQRLHGALEQAVNCCEAVVLWRKGTHFCTGMNGQELRSLLGQAPALMQLQQHWRDCLDRCRDLPIPVVAAVQGDCQGVGAELLLYCDRVVASMGSRFALRGTGASLVSGAGGFTALARRAYAEAGLGGLALVVRYLPWLSSGTLIPNAVAAQEAGLLRCADSIVMHPGEVLYVAHQQALGLARSGYRCAPLCPLPVPGREGLSILQLRGFRAPPGSLTRALAQVLVGGEVAPGTYVDEATHRELEARLWPQSWQARQHQSTDISPAYPCPMEISFDGVLPADLA